jgi:hypothetical protein
MKEPIEELKRKLLYHRTFFFGLVAQEEWAETILKKLQERYLEKKESFCSQKDSGSDSE